MGITESLAVIPYPNPTPYHRDDKRPTSAVLRETRRQIVANLRSLPNDENDDNMGQINTLLADPDYTTLSATGNVYVEPDQVPAQANIPGLDADGRRVAIYNNGRDQEGQNNRRLTEQLAVTQIVNAGDAKIHLSQFYNEFTGWSHNCL